MTALSFSMLVVMWSPRQLSFRGTQLQPPAPDHQKLGWEPFSSSMPLEQRCALRHLLQWWEQ